jgi:hypothetical protein
MFLISCNIDVVCPQVSTCGGNRMFRRPGFCYLLLLVPQNLEVKALVNPTELLEGWTKAFLFCQEENINMELLLLVLFYFLCFPPW